MCPIKAGIGVSSAVHMTVIEWSAKFPHVAYDEPTVLPQSVQAVVDVVKVKGLIVAVMLRNNSFSNELLYGEVQLS
jgi:hypothetical protein